MTDKKKEPVEQDKLADDLVVLITDSISNAIGRTGLNPGDPRVQKSLLRAIGGSMAVLAHSALVGGIKAEDAKDVVIDNFNLKFDYGMKVSQRMTKGPLS